MSDDVNPRPVDHSGDDVLTRERLDEIAEVRRSGKLTPTYTLIDRLLATARAGLDQLAEAEQYIAALRAPLLVHFGTTDPELVREQLDLRGMALVSYAAEQVARGVRTLSETEAGTDRDEKAWLIEVKRPGDRPLWWSGNTRGPGEAWTTIHSHAVRFAREEDADAVIRGNWWDGIDTKAHQHAHAVEHIWLDDGRPRSGLADMSESERKNG